VRYPSVVAPHRVGKYDPVCFAGGGYVWDEVLEYRVWVHPQEGGDDWYCAFATYSRALAYSKRTKGAEEPVALILQREYIDESRIGHYVHVRKRRITEWPVDFLARPRRTPQTIPDFLAPDAPKNRLAILRGDAKDRRRRAADNPRT
jgi:putative acetyltransferase